MAINANGMAVHKHYNRQVQAQSSTCKIPAIVTVSKSFKTDGTTAVLDKCNDVCALTQACLTWTVNFDGANDAAYCYMFSSANGDAENIPQVSLVRALDTNFPPVSAEGTEGIPYNGMKGYYYKQNLPVDTNHCIGVTNSTQYSLTQVGTFDACQDVCDVLGRALCDWFTYNRQNGMCSLNYIPNDNLSLGTDGATDVGTYGVTGPVIPNSYLTNGFLMTVPNGQIGDGTIETSDGTSCKTYPIEAAYTDGKCHM